MAKTLYEITEELQRILDLEDGRKTRIDDDTHVGKSWDGHASRSASLMHRNYIDMLQQQARENHPQSPTVFRRLLGFVACRCLQNIEFGECLLDWKDFTFEDGYTTPKGNLILLEKYSILVCQMQQSPEEQLVSHRNEIGDRISKDLDDIADDCKNRIQQSERQAGKPMYIADKLLLVKDVIVKEHQFAGNTENYYDYRNSLLGHVLKTKKGIPITLCILFACVCSRLDLLTYLVGLPGHVVLGFQSDGGEQGTERILYLDVFRTGRVLSERDCQAICASYGVAWNQQYLRPLTAGQVLDRTFNNLSNCHLRGIAHQSTYPFRTELYYRQRALSSIHRHQRSIAEPLVDRMARDLTLILSPELLRHYNLLSDSLWAML
ncbi:MAG: hypothetical protein SGBAC_002124 [Bacillariaceae sp.]